MSKWNQLKTLTRTDWPMVLLVGLLSLLGGIAGVVMLLSLTAWLIGNG